MLILLYANRSFQELSQLLFGFAKYFILDRETESALNVFSATLDSTTETEKCGCRSYEKVFRQMSGTWKLLFNEEFEE